MYTLLYQYCILDECYRIYCIFTIILSICRNWCHCFTMCIIFPMSLVANSPHIKMQFIKLEGIFTTTTYSCRYITSNHAKAYEQETKKSTCFVAQENIVKALSKPTMDLNYIFVCPKHVQMLQIHQSWFLYMATMTKKGY